MSKNNNKRYKYRKQKKKQNFPWLFVALGGVLLVAAAFLFANHPIRSAENRLWLCKVWRESPIHAQGYQHRRWYTALQGTALHRSRGGMLTSRTNHRFDGNQAWRKHHD